jgi:hypothetical protein
VRKDPLVEVAVYFGLLKFTVPGVKITLPELFAAPVSPLYDAVQVSRLTAHEAHLVCCHGARPDGGKDGEKAVEKSPTPR